MNAQQATIFQWCSCTFVLYMVFVTLYFTYRNLRAGVSEYDIQEAADDVAREAWTRTEATE